MNTTLGDRRILLTQIDLGDRRREDDHTDIEALAAGIKKFGLLFPLIVRRVNGRYQLVAGGRRYRALQLLGETSAPVREFEQLSDEDLREIELEENQNRRDLSEKDLRRTFAVSKRTVADAKKAAAVISEGGSEKNPKDPRGRKKQGAASKDEVADALGISRPKLLDAERHVETAERFPFMQGDAWRQSHVLAVREQLETIPEAERESVVGVLACAKLLDPASAVDLVTNIGAKTPKERTELYRLSQSDDPRDRSHALSSAAENPPLPDPRLNCIESALIALRHATSPYPKDPLTPRIKEVMAELRKIRGAVEEVSFDARREMKKEASR